MAITVVSRPDDFSAVYIPTQYKFTSDLSPAKNNYVQTIIGIGELIGNNSTQHGFPDPAQVVIMAAPFPEVNDGEFIEIQNTSLGLYTGIFRILQVSGISANVLRIEAIDKGEDSGGTAGRFLKDYSIVLDLYINGNLEVRLRRQHDQSDQFVFDVGTEIAQFIGSSLMAYGATAIATAVDACKSFYVKYTDEYAILDTSTGIEIVTRQDDDEVNDEENNKLGINAVVPYADIVGNIIRSVNYDLSDFIMTQSSTNARFMTTQPSAITIGDNDHYQLMAILNGAGGSNLFTDGDDGTMEADITGIVAGGHITGLAQDCTTAFEGSCSATGEMSPTFVLDNYFRHSSDITLVTGETYTVRCRFLVKEPFSQFAGEASILMDPSHTFAGAAVTTVKSWASNNPDQQTAGVWYELETTITPAADVTGRFVVRGSITPDFTGKNINIDKWEVQRKTSTYNLRIEEFDNAGSSLGTTDTSFVVNNKQCYNLPVGTANVGAAVSASAVKYEATVLNDSLTAISESLTFNVNRKCARNEFRFYWVNTKGGIDSYTFTGETQRKLRVSESTFKRNLDAPRVLPERQLTTVNVEPVETQTANSGLVNRSVSEWLEGLLQSPEVYIEMLDQSSGDKEFLPVHINKGSFDINTSNDAVSNVSFEWRISVDRVIQKN